MAMSSAAVELEPCPHCGAQHGQDELVCPQTERAIPLDGRVLDGKFRLLTLLGRGGMASVWRAENQLVHKYVAIKLMRAEYLRDEETLARFRNEATAAGKIGSPHICDILDFGQSPIGPYIVMEVLKGPSMADLLEKRGRLEPRFAVLIARQALVGLAAAHRAGIIHRDLKPENVFLHRPEPGRLIVKLMDFGISKFAEGGETRRTGVGVVMGTPEYMSPEQLAGAHSVDERADIWAMGVILYRALTGVEAFQGTTIPATLLNVSACKPVDIRALVPNVSGDLANVVHRCLSKEPRDRYSSAEALYGALEAFDELGHLPNENTQLRSVAELVAEAFPTATGSFQAESGSRPGPDVDAETVALPAGARLRADGTPKAPLASNATIKPKRRGTRLVLLIAAMAAMTFAVREYGYEDELDDAADLAVSSVRELVQEAAVDAQVPLNPVHPTTSAQGGSGDRLPNEPRGPAVPDSALVADIAKAEAGVAEAGLAEAGLAEAVGNASTGASLPSDDPPDGEADADPLLVIEEEPPMEEAATSSEKIPRRVPRFDPRKLVRAGNMYAPRSAPRGNYVWARSYCAKLKAARFAGLGKWHLGNSNEASTFSRAHALKSHYWMSPAKRGKAFVITMKTGKRAYTSAASRDPKAFCVSKR